MLLLWLLKLRLHWKRTLWSHYPRDQREWQVHLLRSLLRGFSGRIEPVLCMRHKYQWTCDLEHSEIFVMGSHTFVCRSCFCTRRQWWPEPPKKSFDSVHSQHDWVLKHSGDQKLRGSRSLLVQLFRSSYVPLRTFPSRVSWGECCGQLDEGLCNRTGIGICRKVVDAKP